MIELLITCFPLLIRVAYLRLRKREITVYAVHRAIFVWMVLFFALIFTIEYYHPDSRNALIPFRIVPVVPETSGTVTEIMVVGGQQVKRGDLLFTIDDSSEQAAVAASQAQVAEVQSQIALAKSEVQEAQAEVLRAQADQAEAELTMTNLERLGQENSPAYAEDKYLRAKDRFDAASAEVSAAEYKVQSLQLQVDQVLPAQLTAAKAQLNQKQVELSKTRVTAMVDGRIDQLTLNVGDRAAQIALNPSMVIVPDVSEESPLEIVGGFSQVNRAVLHEGMPAEVACSTNINSGMKNSVFPARVTRVQEAVATGQLGPTGSLLQPSQQIQRGGPGDLVVYLRLVYPEHQAMLVEGSGCLVQAYTTKISGPMAGTFMGEVIQAWALEKALIMRMKVWIMLFMGTGLGGEG
ncbi:HlyD family secretion protein [Marinibacterium profundimaris]|uniref:Multidrug resistance protein MdtA-like barrel-sandwich hybrid domain-containing protein n=1 Tax=Marinibacterium profundimaris TaxID=1679460 RepID=A0A225NP87_9RHOB|nr:biotin/lipoyl-binding protein [Marinibacterium profundimaris]OWU74641.1 hypothetical protein ATO3_08390 [Marinibacterium profundimaris]